ncbi:MAG: tetratricopeptide repeat protein [Bryobacterales bacterium]|nr:tetratricopeptide repeat protein [Bryobacterales bacterium]
MLRPAFLAILACCFCGPLVCAQDRAAFEAMWKDAVSAHQQNRVDAAIAAYEAILELQPRFVPALSNLGAVLARQARFSEAAERYQEALRIDPSQQGVRLNLALAYYKQSLLPQAAAELETLRAADPKAQQATVLLADCYLRQGEYAKVITLLDPLAADDDRAIAYLLGTALIRQKQTERGQRLIDRIFKDGESAEGLMLLGNMQFLTQENKQAIASFERAIKINPQLPELHSSYARAKLTDGDPEGAKAAFAKELEHNPFDFDSNLHLGSLYRVEKDLDQAERYLKQAARVRPHDISLRYQLGSLELSKGNVARAAELLESVVRDSPRFLEGHITLATAYYRLKRKADGDRERAIVEKLNAEAQARELKSK